MTVAAVLLDGTGALDLSAASGRSLLALTYLIVAGGITFSAYVWALQHLPISTIVSHQYVNPAVAVVLGAVFLDESLGVSAVIGAALVIVAVFATVRSESSPVAHRRGARPGVSAGTRLRQTSRVPRRRTPGCAVGRGTSARPAR